MVDLLTTDKSTEVSFRKYQPADLQPTFDLHVLAMKEIGAYSGARWDYDFDDIEGTYLGEFYVGELDHQIIAIGALRKISETAAEVRRVRVHPAHQRRGVGQLILDLLTRRGKEIGYTHLHLDTLPWQTAAQELYKKNGFIQTGTQLIEGWEVLLFEKDLTRS